MLPIVATCSSTLSENLLPSDAVTSCEGGYCALSSAFQSPAISAFPPLHDFTSTSVLTCSQLGMVGMDGLWPSQQDAPGFQHTAEAFMAHCHRVSRALARQASRRVLGLTLTSSTRCSHCHQLFDV